MAYELHRSLRPSRHRRDTFASRRYYKGKVSRIHSDGTIDVISSGHDPRGPEDKRLPFSDAEPGMAGAETLLAMTLSLVRDELIDLPRAFDLLSLNPARLLGVNAGALKAGFEADVALIDPEKPWIIQSEKMAATAGNGRTPRFFLALQRMHVLGSVAWQSLRQKGLNGKPHLWKRLMVHFYHILPAVLWLIVFSL